MEQDPMFEKGLKRKLPASFGKATVAAAHQTVQALRLPVGCITYAAAQEDVEHVCQSILASGVKALGFDIEWHVTYRTGEVPRPVAVVQLASPIGSAAVRCYLLHIACSGLTQSLRKILCSPVIRKAGVGITGDAQKLMRDFALQCEGLVDLSEEANLRLCHPSSGRLPEKWSLARLAEWCLRRSIGKDQTLRTGNWEIWPLSAEQQQYAALDAYASLLAYKHLMALPVPVLDLPPPPAAVPDQTSSQACEPLHVPEHSSRAPLQPAKLGVWKLFMEQGVSVEAIAGLRHLKLDTVESYLAAAMTAGKAYDWHRLQVSEGVLAAVIEHASTQLAAAARDVKSGTGIAQGVQQHPRDDPGMPQHSCAYGQSSQSSEEHDYLDVCCAQRATDHRAGDGERIHILETQNDVPESQEGVPTALNAVSNGAVTQDRHPESSCVYGASTDTTSSAARAGKGADDTALGSECLADADKAPSMSAVPSMGQPLIRYSSSASLPPDRPVVDRSNSSDAICRRASAVPQTGSASRAAAVRCGAAEEEQSISLLSRLQGLGITIKVLKEQLPESIRSGQIRLCLVHADRLCLL